MPGDACTDGIYGSALESPLVLPDTLKAVVALGVSLTSSTKIRNIFGWVYTQHSFVDLVLEGPFAVAIWIRFGSLAT